jgi:hypothetical protein
MKIRWGCGGEVWAVHLRYNPQHATNYLRPLFTPLQSTLGLHFTPLHTTFSSMRHGGRTSRMASVECHSIRNACHPVALWLRWYKVLVCELGLKYGLCAASSPQHTTYNMGLPFTPLHTTILLELLFTPLHTTYSGIRHGCSTLCLTAAQSLVCD